MIQRPSGVKAIVFDCFGVLTTDLWREFCASLPDGPALDRARVLNRAYDAGQISREEFLREVQETTGHAPQEVEKLLDNEINKNSQLLEYIAGLKQRGYKIGLLSNIATNWIRDRFLTAEEQAVFDAMVFSFEVGMAKPDAGMFKTICQKLGVEPQQAVMIDDIDRYCDAARTLGMQAITYQNFSQLQRELGKLL